MIPMTPGLLMVVVRNAFRIGQSIFEMHDERVRAAEVYVTSLGVGHGSLDNAALNVIWRDLNLRQQYPGVFDLRDTLNYTEQLNPDPDQRAKAIEAGLAIIGAGKPLPEWAAAAGVSTTGVVTIHSLMSPQARKQQWTRFGLLMAKVGIEALAAQPNIVGLKGRAETLVGAFASKVDAIVGPDIELGDQNGHSFKERAAAVLLQASLQTITENSEMVVSAPHWAEFVSNVLTPVANAQADQQGQLLTLDRLSKLMRGPMAQAALSSIADHQQDFFGKRFASDRAAGAVTQEILAAAVNAQNFDIVQAFSQRGLSTIYSAALDAAAKRPELFLRGESVDPSWQKLLGGVAGVLRDAPPPFDHASGLGDKLTCCVIDVAAEHLTARALADAGSEGPWGQVGGQILGNVIGGFSAALKSNASAAPGTRINPFQSVFNQDQIVEVVHLIAAQAAQTPGMLVGKGASSEVFAIAQGVATFMADPNTSLASPADWRAVIGVAIDEAAKNPATLFRVDANVSPENQLAVSLVSMFLQNAAAGFKAPQAAAASAGPRRLGSLLFGDTLRQALSMTLRAAANNARALLSAPTHLAALNSFVQTLQTYTAEQGGRVGAAEWLWLYRSFVAEVIEKGPEADISPERFEAALKASPNFAPAAPDTPVEEPTP